MFTAYLHSNILSAQYGHLRLCWRASRSSTASAAVAAAAQQATAQAEGPSVEGSSGSRSLLAN